MVEPEEARAALADVRAREGRVRAELAAHRPPWWTSALVLFGFFVLLAGLDFSAPVPFLALAAGAALVGVGLWRGTRWAARCGVKSRRGAWSTRNILLTGCWIVGLYAAFAVTTWIFDGMVPRGVPSVLAALPATVIYGFMVDWLYRNSYGAPARGTE